MKKMKKLIKNLIITTLTTILVVFSLIPNNVQASGDIDTSNMSEEDLRNAFVEQLKSFANANPGDNCIYPDENRIFIERNETYNNGIYSDGKYHFDCVGWVNYALHNLGLGLGPEIMTGSNCIISPNIPHINDSHFELAPLGSERPGDVLIANGDHVAIYIGNYQVVDMWTSGLAIRTFGSTDYFAYNKDGRRVCYTDVAHLSNFDGITFSPIEAGGWGLGGFKPQGEIDYYDPPLDLDELEFEFAGNPAKMEYNGETQPVQWLFSKFSQFIDLLIGIVLAGFRAAFVGWATIIEDLAIEVLNILSYGL